jgi:hypothetical protein
VDEEGVGNKGETVVIKVIDYGRELASGNPDYREQMLQESTWRLVPPAVMAAEPRPADVRRFAVRSGFRIYVRIFLRNLRIADLCRYFLIIFEFKSGFFFKINVRIPVVCPNFRISDLCPDSLDFDVLFRICPVYDRIQDLIMKIGMPDSRFRFFFTRTRQKIPPCSGFDN